MTAMIAWNIWNNRNDIVWNKKNNSTDWILRQAKYYLDQWRQVQGHQVLTTQTERNVGQISRLWREPGEGWVKCNTDAAIFEHKDYTGYECVIRDANGKMVAVDTTIYYVHISLIETTLHHI